jgi:hypothetical protein
MLLSTITCTRWVPNVFEHFAVNAGDIKSRITTITNLIREVETGIDSIQDDRDTACEIQNQAEEGTIGSRSAATDESEYSLPPDEQKKLSEKRKVRAKERFKEEKTMYASLHGGTPVLECFAPSATALSSAAPPAKPPAEDTAVSASSAADISEAEDDLNEKVNELQTLMNTSAVTKAKALIQTVNQTLGFNAKYVQQALSLMADADKKKEGFATKRKGQDLLTAADKVIAEANAFVSQIPKLRAATQQQKSALSAMNKKTQDTKTNTGTNEVLPTPPIQPIGFLSKN